MFRDDHNSMEQFSGWLRKYGGLFKASKRYFFVLEKGRLDYYSGEDRQRQQNSFKIDNPPVEIVLLDVDSSNDDKGCHFVLKRRTEDGLSPTSEQSKTQIHLSANSSSERQAWCRAIRKQLFIGKGGGLFGTHLSEIFRYTSAETKFVPRVVYDTVEFIRLHGVNNEGIFRKCGAKHTVNEVCDAYDEGNASPILDPNVHDPYVASDVLKKYLRELPEPLIPYRLYDRLKATGFLIEDGQSLQPIIDQLDMLPAPNYNVIRYLCQFLHEVSLHSDKNLMTVENLARMFAPSILRSDDDDPDVEISTTHVITLTVSGFINCQDKLFARECVPLHQLQSRAAAGPKLLLRSASRNEVMRDAVISLRRIQNTVLSELAEAQPQFWFARDSGQSSFERRPNQINPTQTPAHLPSGVLSLEEPVTQTPNSMTASGSSSKSDVNAHMRKNSQTPPSASRTNTLDNLNNSDLELNAYSTIEEVRYWKSQALLSRAQAVCDRAKVESLKADLARTQCDLDMAEMELGLLRKRLASLEDATRNSNSYNSLSLRNRDLTVLQ